MTSLMMFVQRKGFFGSVEEAREPLAALARELAAASSLGSMWTRFRGVVLPLDLETIELLLTEGRSIRADTPGHPTHVIPLQGLPAGPGEIGRISITVRLVTDPPIRQGACVGLSLSVGLPDTSCASGADALRRLLGGCFDAALADSGAIGPGAVVKELGTGWATATRRTGGNWLPAGATLSPTRTGSIAIAHREDPASASAPAREAVLRVREALNGSSVQAPIPVPRAAPVVQPVILTPPPPALRPGADLSSTISAPSLPVPHQLPKNPLPFGGAPSAEFVASFAAPASTTPHPAVGETLPLGANMLANMLPALPFDKRAISPVAGPGKRHEIAETLPLGANMLSTLLPTLPFNQPAHTAGAAVAPPARLPDLTLDAYASLCAELAVFPTKTEEIFRKYGVADDQVQRGLHQRWQDLFTTAPPLRDEWQRKTTAFCDWLRRSGR